MKKTSEMNKHKAKSMPVYPSREGEETKEEKRDERDKF
jgi:hypothetical protein